MRFGIFYEHQLPRPWDARDEYRLMQDAFEQIELADRLGIEYVWEVEHHFLEEYSHSSAPEVFLAGVSQRTKNIRLGHGIIQTSPLYNHPARTAERVATLDLISGGRVEFGSGESATTGEMGGFNIDPLLKREQWREGLEVAIRCLTETPFTGVEGKWVSMPPRNVVPKPLQRPHPPLWVAASRRETIMLAAEEGLGALTFAFIDPEEAREWIEAHEKRLARCKPIGELVNTDIACVTPMMVHHDESEAIRRGLEGGNFFGYSLAFFAAFGDHIPGTTNLWEDFQNRRNERGYDPEIAIAKRQELLGAKIAAGESSALRGAVGTPEQLREYLRRFEEVGVDQLIFVLQAGKNRHEHIMESIELFGREILPEFKDRDEKQRALKAARLEPLVNAALERKERTAPSMPEGYSVPPVAREFFRDAGGDALLERIATDSAVGDSSIRDQMPREKPPTD
jgi:alkanesulfonate monooxygenase SsuD/methylene tetrahydromethanopterin reductase-like flavin-dependent oxidoreductase (luciferase family)